MNNKMECTVEFREDFDRPSSMTNKAITQANSSYLTEETEAISFSEEGDEVLGPCTGAIVIDDFLYDDEKDSVSVATLRTSLLDGMDEQVTLFSDGIPKEIVVLNEDALSRNDQDCDVHQRLLIAETLAQSYKAKMLSTEDLIDNLHEFLRQAQTYAEDVLADRNELLQQIQEMQEEEQTNLDQRMLLKVIMASSLCYYMCGGSPIFLTSSVILNLLADTVNALV
jgi:hypothetical protein